LDIFDSHCHLDFRDYDGDRDAVLSRAANAGVRRMMIVGTDLASSAKAVDLARTLPGCYAAVGVHPHDARTCSEDSLQRLKSLVQEPRVRAWGEIGLDFNRMHSPQKDQEFWLLRQLETALGLDLPVIFHERDSKGRLLEILRAAAPGGLAGVVHCFSGNTAELTAYLDLGLHIGITGIVTIKKRGAALRELILQIPTDRILVETDAPFLTPTPERNRNRRNEPAFVRTVLKKVAAVKQISPDTLAPIVWENTCRLFNLPFRLADRKDPLPA